MGLRAVASGVGRATGDAHGQGAVNVLTHGADPTGVVAADDALDASWASLPQSNGLWILPASPQGGGLKIERPHTFSGKFNVRIVGDARLFLGAGYTGGLTDFPLRFEGVGSDPGTFDQSMQVDIQSLFLDCDGKGNGVFFNRCYVSHPEKAVIRHAWGTALKMDGCNEVDVEAWQIDGCMHRPVPDVVAAADYNNATAYTAGNIVKMPLTAWSSGTTYGKTINDWVSRSGKAYRSIIANNLNNDPATSPLAWEPVPWDYFQNLAPCTGKSPWDAGVDYTTQNSIETTVAVAAIAGATTVTLTSAASFTNGMSVTLQLTSGAFHTTTLSGAPSGNVITLAAALPSATFVGAFVGGNKNWVQVFDHLPMIDLVQSSVSGFGNLDVIGVNTSYIRHWTNKTAIRIGNRFRRGTPVEINFIDTQNHGTFASSVTALAALYPSLGVTMPDDGIFMHVLNCRAFRITSGRHLRLAEVPGLKGVLLGTRYWGGEIYDYDLDCTINGDAARQIGISVMPSCRNTINQRGLLNVSFVLAGANSQNIIDLDNVLKDYQETEKRFSGNVTVAKGILQEANSAAIIAPPAGQIQREGRTVAGRVLPHIVEPSGRVTMERPRAFRRAQFVAVPQLCNSTAALSAVNIGLASILAPTRVANTNISNYATAASSNSDTGIGPNDVSGLLLALGVSLSVAFDLPDANYGTGATGARLGIGFLAGGGTSFAAADAPSFAHILLQWSSNRGDTNWQISVNPASGTPALTNTGLPFLAGKAYEFYLHAEPGGAAVGWELRNVTDGTSASGTISSNLPATTTALGLGMVLRTLSAVARNIRFRGLDGEIFTAG